MRKNRLTFEYFVLLFTMIQNNYKTKAKLFASRWHKGQYRRDGVTPHFSHVQAVAKRLEDNGESDEVVAVGFLHDVLEDTPATVKALFDSGFSKKIVDAVDTLTKRKNQSYINYIDSVMHNDIATKVKIQDMLHNLSDNPTNKQIKKYAQGLLELVD